MKPNIAFLLLFLLLTVPPGAAQQASGFGTDSGQVEFHSSVPLHEFTGTSGHLTGIIDADENLVDFYLDLSTLRTGNSRRDRDMFRTLNVEEHPFAEFTGSAVTPWDIRLREAQPVTVEGILTLNGISREVRIDGTLTPDGEELLLKAGWVQSLSDHEISPPGLLFYRVRDEVDIRIEARLKPGFP